MRSNRSGHVGDFVYDLSGNLVTWLGTNATWGRGELFLGSMHLGTYMGDFTYFVHTDLIGSERVRTDQNGNVAQTCTFWLFGDWQSCTGISFSSNYRYAGYERDPETGLDHMWFRYYNSRLGRFMSADPLGGSIFNPQSLNRFAYVVNDPTNYFDPLGLCPAGEHQTGSINGDPICEPDEHRSDNFNDAHNGPGNGSGCSIGIGLFTITFSACPFGSGGRQGRIRISGPIHQQNGKKCFDGSSLPVDQQAILGTLSASSSLLNEALYVGTNVSGALTAGAVGKYGATLGYTSGFAATPDGGKAYVIGIEVNATVGTPGLSATVQIGAANYQDLSGFAASSFGKEAGVGVGFGVGAGYNTNSSGVFTYANVGFAGGANASPETFSYNLVIPFCKE